jgi:hypothetical protein
MDFKHAKRNRRLDIWAVVTLLVTFSLGLNFLVSQIDHQIDLTPGKKMSLSRESLALLNQMEQDVDLVITIPEDSGMPKIMQRFMHDLELLTDALERADTPFPIRVHRINVYAPKKKNDILNKYKISEPNLFIAASPQNGVRVIFRYKNEKSVNPYNNSQAFRSAESLARQAIWEAGFYSNWKEIKDGILEPGKFRGEETLVKSILDVSVPSQTNKTIYFVRGHGEASPADTDPRAGNSLLRGLIEDRNIGVDSLDLGTIERMPDDAIGLIISGPKAIFQDKEIAMIRNFINREKGSLLLALDPVDEISITDRPALGLRPLLKEWGVRCHDMLIYDPQRENFDLFSGSYFLRTYQSNSSHPLVKNLMNEGFSILTDRCRPVEVEKKTGSAFIGEELLFSSRDSWALSSWTERNMPPDKNPLLDLVGPVPVLSISVPNPTKAPKEGLTSAGKLIVLGSSKILSNEKLRSGAGNQALARNIIYWMDQKDEMLEVPPRILQSYSITMSDDAFDEVIYYFVSIPICVLFLGIFVSWLRKEL